VRGRGVAPWVVTAGLSLAATACITVGLGEPRAVPEDRFHALDAALLEPLVRRADEPPPDAVVAVRTFGARRRFDDRVVVRREHATLAYLEFERWTEPPDLAVTDAVREALAASGLVRAAFPAGEGHLAHLVLDGYVLDFEVREPPEGPLVAHARVRLDLGDMVSGELVSSGAYAGTAELPGRTVDGLPQAMGRALGAALGSALASWRAGGVLERRGTR
jgi:ABC-type uncharacterized transport system auxiliary subunit